MHSLLGINTDSFFFQLAAYSINDDVLSPLLDVVTYLESSILHPRESLENAFKILPVQWPIPSDPDRQGQFPPIKCPSCNAYFCSQLLINAGSIVASVASRIQAPVSGLHRTAPIGSCPWGFQEHWLGLTSREDCPSLPECSVGHQSQRGAFGSNGWDDFSSWFCSNKLNCLLLEG